MHIGYGIRWILFDGERSTEYIDGCFVHFTAYKFSPKTNPLPLSLISGSGYYFTQISFAQLLRLRLCKPSLDHLCKLDNFAANCRSGILNWSKRASAHRAAIKRTNLYIHTIISGQICKAVALNFHMLAYLRSWQYDLCQIFLQNSTIGTYVTNAYCNQFICFKKTLIYAWHIYLGKHGQEDVQSHKSY